MLPYWPLSHTVVFEATTDTAQVSVQVFRTIFPGRIILYFRDITWPTHLPYLAEPDCFFWSYIKSKVYETSPANINGLKQRIQEFIQGFPKKMLKCVVTAFPWWLQECNEWHGGHQQSLIFKIVMVQMNSHGHEIYLLVLINFPVCLTMYLI